MVQNGAPLGQMIIELGLETSAFSSSLTGATRATKTAVREMASGFKVLDSGGKKIDALSFKQQALNKVITAQKNELGYLKQAYDKTLDSQGNATSTTAKAAQKYNEAQAKLAGYEAQLQTTSGQLARLKVETQGVTGWMNSHADAYIKQGEAIAKFGSKVSSIGSTLTKSVSLPIAAGFTLATKAASDFTTQIGAIGPLLTNGKAITAEYQQQLDKMSASSKQWAKEYGVSTTEINAGLAEIVRKGYDANQTLGVMPSILDATKASGDEFNDVMNVTTEVISQFNLKGKDYASTVKNASRVTDSLTYVANATSAGFTDLGLAMGYVGPVANSLSMSVEETASAIGILSDAGIGGEQAGTALRGALTRLLKPSKQNIEGFDALGVSVEDFKNGTLTLPDILDKIRKNTEGWTDAQRTAAIAQAFGTESQSAMNVLVGKGGEALRTLTKETEGAAGATQKIAKSMNDLPANKVERFKKSLEVLQITIGEKLLPVVTPWLEKATDMINKFSELDDSTQLNIIKWGAMVAAVGPAVKILGTVTKGFGLARTGVGLLNKGLVELAAKAAERSAITATTTAITGMGTSATTAGAALAGGGAVGGTSLVAGLGAIAGPAAIAVGAIAAVGLAAYAGVKAYEAHQLAGGKWGTSVTKEQDKVIDKSYELREKAVGYVNEYADGIQSSAKKAIKANEDIVTSIENTLKKERERDEKAAQGLYSKAAQKRAQDYLEGQKALDEENIALAKKTTGRINEVLKSASDENRQLSDAERQYIAANYNRLSDEQLKAAGFTKNQRIAIESAYQTDLSKLTTKELQTRAENVMSALDKEQSAYEKQKTKLAEVYGKGTENYKAELAKLDEANQQSNESMILGLAKLTLQQGFSLDQMSGAWEKYGWTTQEVQALVNASNNTTTENLDMMAKATNEAGIAWNQLALDPKTGEVKTNMADTLVEIAKTDEGWNQLKFMAKNADLSTNAKEEIAIAMGEAGKWETMYLTDKELLVNGDEAQLVLYDTIDKLGLWNQYNADRKTLGVNNADAIYELMAAQGKLQEWNSLPPQLKTLLATDPAKMTIKNTESALKQYNALPPALKKLIGNNSNLISNVDAAKQRLVNYQLYNPDTKKLSVIADTSGATIARQAINSVQGKSVVVDVEYRGRKTGAGALAFAKGTNYHRGGDMIVNDQKGPMYKELVKFPGQEPFIPQGRNVYIPDAPVGTKVVKASLTKMMMKRLGIPRYADGVGVPRDSDFVRNLESAGNKQVVVHSNNQEMVALLKQMLNYISKSKPEINIYPQNWSSKDDIRRTSQELAYLTQINTRGALQ